MPTLWGNPRDSDQSDRRSEDGGSSNERTRLLENHRETTPGLLTPDDPAVSPYNLWTVRMFRHITVVLTLITAIWWIILLISTFVTPPGFHMRGSGFFAFGNTTVALLVLILDLAFFRTPSQSARILCACMALALLVNTILTLAVQMVRYEEGWVGVTSISWVLLISLWVLAADRTVEWGKAEEEERLTGRPETRRSLGEWSKVLTSTVGLFALCLAVILMTLTLILRSLDAGVAPPGNLYWVDSGHYKMHVFCEPNVPVSTERDRQQPTVLFEGGEYAVENGLADLAYNAVRNGSISRYCYVDRPGYAWSDTAPSPLSAGMEAVIMSEALAQAGERGPWVVASAGVGSYYSRIFASQHGSEVKGLLLIDPLHDDDLDRLASPKRGILLWLWGIISPLGLDTLPGAIFMGRKSADRIWGISSKHNPKHIFARLQESLVASSLTKREVLSSRNIMQKDTALTVITSGVEVKRHMAWEGKQRDLTKLTSNLKHWDVVDDAPHEVWRTFEGREMIEKRLGSLVRGR